MPQKRGDNGILAHFIPEIKTKGHDVIGVNVFPRKLMRFPAKERNIRCALYYWTQISKTTTLHLH